MIIKNYDIIHNVSMSNFLESMAKYIEAGWQPFGNPWRTQEGEMFQAVVKYQ